MTKHQSTPPSGDVRTFVIKPLPEIALAILWYTFTRVDEDRIAMTVSRHEGDGLPVSDDTEVDV